MNLYILVGLVFCFGFVVCIVLCNEMEVLFWDKDSGCFGFMRDIFYMLKFFLLIMIVFSKILIIIFFLIIF